MTEILSGFVKDAFPELFVEGQVVTAEQTFHRKLAEYEMNIEQQKLFREDLRDLVELTVGRMDVYHLVGALLLEFCIDFYCENRMLEEASESQMKSFLVVFFLISNLSACGFLIFSVWLSMHASVASHSIGVRLLTSFARLSIPGRKELEEVAKAPLVPMMERFRILGKRLGLRHQEAHGHESEAEVAEASLAAAEALRQETQDLARAAAGLGTSADVLAIQEGAKALSDREYHFRRFLKEQRRWLFYDAYARVCMALGMNQLLCSLSYYIVGAIAEETPSGAALSLLGVQCLALLLLRLDVAEGIQQWSGILAVLVCMSFPPLYIGILVHFVQPDSVRSVEFMALPAFVLHSMWMLLIAAYLVPASVDEGLPKQLRTVLYLDVLHLEQQEIADEMAAQQEKDSMAGLNEAKMSLREAMRAVLEEEASEGAASATRRTKPELLELEERLRAEIAEARVLDLTTPRYSTRSQIRSAERTIEHFAIWRAAPEINANLAALSNPKVADWLSERQREELSQAYQSFLLKCKELDLGITSAASARTAASSASNPSADPAGSAPAARRLNALEVAEGEERRVRVEAPPELMGAMGGYQAQSVYIDSDGGINHEASRSIRTTSFNGTFSTDLPQWNQSALRLMHQDTQQECQIAEIGSSSSSFRGPRMNRMLTRRQRQLTRTLSGQTYAAADAARDTARRVVEAGSSLMPATAVPPHALPGVLVRRFAFLVAFLWLATGTMHCLRWTGSRIIEGVEIGEIPPGPPVAATWPPPGRLFEVDALYCQGSKLLVQNRFGLYSGERSGNTVSGFEEVDCGADPPCRALMKMSEEKQSFAQSQLDSAQPVVAGDVMSNDQPRAAVHLPSSWRRMAIHRPLSNSTSGEVMRLVGWDGKEVVVATRRSRDGRVQPRFVLQPELGCTSVFARSWPKASALLGHRCVASPENYTDVQALEFAAEGRLLLVLHGGTYLDAWHLTAGKLLGRWRLPQRGAAAFCLQERSDQLVVARRMSRSAPELEVLPLPSSLRGFGCEETDHVAVASAAKLIV